MDSSLVQSHHSLSASIDEPIGKPEAQLKMKEAYEGLQHDLWEEGRRQRETEEAYITEGAKKQSELEHEASIKQKEEALNHSLETLVKEVTKYDDEQVKGWNDDIDTLLVFAGLFAAVVTAFLIESYQWLKEDPQDTAVTLLTQISRQLNGSQPVTFQRTTFSPEASSIRINCFWFLSLVFGLTSALFGLLCKQWLREHQRDVPTRTPAEALALKQLRRDSFERWGVASLLSALPILLEIALMLFFAGILDLLWSLHPIPFGTSLAAVALSAGSYFLTTFLPTIMVPRDQTSFIIAHNFGQLAHQFICPYKSPQAWAVYQFSMRIFGSLSKFSSFDGFIKIHFPAFWDHIHTTATSWSMFDLQVIRQYNQRFFGDQLQVYELRALQWAVTTFRDSPLMIPHLGNALQTLSPFVAMSVILDRWDVTMWQEVSDSDIGDYLRGENWFWTRPNPMTKDPPLHYREGIELLFSHQLWNGWMDVFQDNPHPERLKLLFRDFAESITQTSLKQSKDFRFYIPFPVVDVLWSHKNPWIRKQSLRLLHNLKESWQPCPGYNEERHDEERLAFTMVLAMHVNRIDRPSELLASERGQAFIRFVNDEIISRRLYSHQRFNELLWRHAIERVQKVRHLPPHYFTPLPLPWEDPAQLPRPETTRYSIETLSIQHDTAAAIPTRDANDFAGQQVG